MSVRTSPNIWWLICLILGAIAVIEVPVGAQEGELLFTDAQTVFTPVRQTNSLNLSDVAVKTDGTNFLLLWTDRSQGTNGMAARIGANGTLLDPHGFWIGGSNVLTTQNVGVSSGRYAFTHTHNRPLAVVFDHLADPFFRSETPLSGLVAPQDFGTLQTVVTAGTPFGFMVWGSRNSQVPSRYVMLSRDGVSGSAFELPTTSATRLKLEGGPYNYLAMWYSTGWQALLVGPDGRIHSSQPLEINRLGTDAAAAANDDAFLVIWPESQVVMGRRISFSGEFLDPLPVRLFSSSEVEFRLFPKGDRWTVVSRNLVVREIFPVGDTIAPSSQRSFSFQLKTNSVAVNERGRGVVAWKDSSGIQFQTWEETGGLSPAIKVLATQPQVKPLISGGPEGYMAAWITGNGSTLQGAFMDGEGELTSVIALTNSRSALNLLGLGHNGPRHLLLYSMAGTQPLGLIFNSEQAIQGGDPRLVGYLSLAAQPMYVLPATNGFMVFNTNGPLRHINLTGGVTTVQGPRGVYASDGGRIWAATQSSTAVTFGELRGGSFSAVATFQGKNPRVAVAGEIALLAWEGTSQLNRSQLQALQFRGGIRLHNLPVTLLELFRNSNNVPFEVVASNTGFLVHGTDPTSGPPNYPLPREFLFHIHAESGLVRSNITEMDAHKLERPPAAGGHQDFLQVSTRGDDGIYVAKQWILPTSSAFSLSMQRVAGYQQLSFHGDPEREYLLERSTDFKSWYFGDFVMPGDLLNMIPRYPGDFQFFRLRLVPY